ncbi:MAG: hypothetical protein Q7S96_01610 [bacterium]|nr:hypothetical protein [bacterium]
MQSFNDSFEVLDVYMSREKADEEAKRLRDAEEEAERLRVMEEGRFGDGVDPPQAFPKYEVIEKEVIE